MNKVCSITILLLITVITRGQTKKINAGGFEMQFSSADTSLNLVFCSVGEMPKFPGGMNKFVAFVKNKIKYPKTAIRDNVQGSVILRFIINEKGKITEKSIYQSARNDLDLACIKMLNRSPIWKPARLNGKAVAVNESLKITFIITN